MTNLEIAKLLRKMAAAYTILGENRFKITAYENAATAVEHATSELKDLWDDGKLTEVGGLGPSIQSHLGELFAKGKSAHIDRVLAKVNPAVFELLEIPGIGPKRAQKLVEELGIRDAKRAIGQLEVAAKKHKIAAMENFGGKSEQDILENIARFKTGAIKERRMVLPQADFIAEEIIAYLTDALGEKILRIDKLGSLRRQVATVGDIDLAVATKHDKEVIRVFGDYPRKVSLIEKGPTGASILLASGRQADLRVAKPTEYGAMLQYFTGSKYHNIRLRDYALKKKLSLNEYGITELKTRNLKRKSIHKFKDEESFYSYLGLDYIPPELREDVGEIEAALNHELPRLVHLGDIKGDLQMHTNFGQETSHDSGVDSIVEMRQMGESLGYEYIAVTDHNPSLAQHSKHRIIAKMMGQKRKVDQINFSTKGTRVLNLLEVDIAASGDLTVPQEGLAFLDGCLISIHSNFNLERSEMTKRVLKAMANPAARILAHPTGRLLQKREGFELDWEKIFRFCLEHDKALEINAYPDRLDLPDTLVRQAVKLGVRLSIGTDAHRKEDMRLMRYGIGVARRGWAEAKNVINTMGYKQALAWLRKRS